MPRMTINSAAVVYIIKQRHMFDNTSCRGGVLLNGLQTPLFILNVLTTSLIICVCFKTATLKKKKNSTN